MTNDNDNKPSVRPVCALCGSDRGARVGADLHPECLLATLAGERGTLKESPDLPGERGW